MFGKLTHETIRKLKGVSIFFLIHRNNTDIILDFMSLKPHEHKNAVQKT